ncbi:MAG: hypothetical protein Q4E94_00290 [Clostridia bacterium]|nr:hypothetical protein [Clostridia bacterium]
MKRLCIVILCLLIMTAVSCGKKESEASPSSIADIPAATADEKVNETENGEAADEKSGSESGERSGGEKADAAKQPDTSDRTPQSDRREIENNIRDAQGLIDDGMLDDAKAVIRSLRTRELTAEEEKKVDSLEAQLLTISD